MQNSDAKTRTTAHAALSRTPKRLAPSAPSDQVLGFEISRVDANVAVRSMIEAARHQEGGFVCVTNATCLVGAATEPAFADAMRRARLILPDSMVVQQARRFLHGGSIPETLYGAEIMDALCAGAAEAQISVGIFGGTPETIAKLERVLAERHPTLNITFSESPPFAPFSVESAARAGAAIAAHDVDLLFVGLGAPKQEKWMAAAESTMPKTLQIGVGAAFDAIAGVVKAPPTWLHRAGFAWLYRLMMEPGRLWRRYAETVLPFFVAILRQKFSSPGSTP